MEEYFVLLPAAAKQGPAREALLILSPPLVGLTETTGWVQRLMPWRVMTDHAENATGQIFSRNLETAMSSCLKVMTSFKTICPTCPRPFKPVRQTHSPPWLGIPHYSWPDFTQSCLYQTWTLDSVILACPRHSGLGPILSLPIIHATVFPVKLQLVWPCSASPSAVYWMEEYSLVPGPALVALIKCFWLRVTETPSWHKQSKDGIGSVILVTGWVSVAKSWHQRHSFFSSCLLQYLLYP